MQNTIMGNCTGNGATATRKSSLWSSFHLTVRTCRSYQFVVHFLDWRKPMERYLTTSEARQKFLTLIDEVGEGDQIIVTKRGVPKAVIVNVGHLETLKAVARLWQDPEALRAM